VTEQPYLAGLRLSGRRVVVVGAGTVVRRRLPALLEAGAVVTVIAPEVSPTVEALAGEGRLTWVPRDYRDGDLDGAWYVVVATDSPVANAAAAAEAERQRIFCVRADDAPAGTAVTPATGRHGAVSLAVLGGGDPGRAATVRDGLLEALRAGAVDDRAIRPVPEHDSGTTSALPGVALVGGGPGDPGLITVRGRELVARADVLIVDRLAPQALLALAPAHAEIIDAAKLPRGRSMLQETINELLVGRALEGRFVVRLKGGDPFVFGRGSEEVEACVAAGVPVTVVPGVTSAISVPALAGIPVTHRELAQEFVVASGHVPPGDPRSSVDWTALGRLRGTLVLLMAVENLASIATALVAGGRAAATPVAIVQEGSLPGERVLHSTLEAVGDEARRTGIRPPAVVVVGPVVRVRPRG
jgi:uroporphyrin-III C-methyltransferase/precorrin-2 dehydrogenase/sirohydrochlorin ferrochelatase